MNLLNLTLLAHQKAVQQDRQIPAERRDLESYPMRWHAEDGVMTPVFDETRLSDRQEADIREILERMAGKVQQKDTKLMVRAHMEAFGRFGVRVTDLAGILSISKPTALKHLRGLEEDGLVYIREEKTRGKAGSPRKRYFWTANQAEYGVEDAFTEGEGGDATDLTIQRDRSIGGLAKSDYGTGIVHHGASAHASQCPDRCLACKWAVREALEGEMRSAARQAGGTGFSVGLAERIAAREAAEEVLFHRLRRPRVSSPAENAEMDSSTRDLARNLYRETR